MRSQFASVILSISSGTLEPALLTRMSTLPNWSMRFWPGDPLRPVRHVGHDIGPPHLGPGANFRERRFQLVLVAARNDHVGPRFGERPGHGFPQSLAPSRHQGHASGQIKRRVLHSAPQNRVKKQLFYQSATSPPRKGEWRCAGVRFKIAEMLARPFSQRKRMSVRRADPPGPKTGFLGLSHLRRMREELLGFPTQLARTYGDLLAGGWDRSGCISSIIRLSSAKSSSPAARAFASCRELSAPSARSTATAWFSARAISGSDNAGWCSRPSARNDSTGTLKRSSAGRQMADLADRHGDRNLR